MRIINHTGRKILIHASKGSDQSIKKELDIDKGFDYEDNELGAIYLHEVEDFKQPHRILKLIDKKILAHKLILLRKSNKGNHLRRKILRNNERHKIIIEILEKLKQEIL